MRKVTAVAHGEHQRRSSLVVPHGVIALSRHDPYDAVTAEQPAGVQAVWMMWLDDDVDALAAVTTCIGPSVTAYLVEERVQWDLLPAQRSHGATPGVKRLSFVRRVPSLSRSQFASHWIDVHAPLARVHHPAICRYVQNVVMDALTPDAPEVDGIAELHFRTYDDLLNRMYDSDDGRARVQADVRSFIDVPAGWRMLGTEHIVRQTPPPTIPA